MLKLPLGQKDFIFEIHDFNLLLLKFSFSLFHGLIILNFISMNAILFRFPLFLHNIIHLLRKLEDLRFQFYVLLYHFLTIWSVLIHLLIWRPLFMRSRRMRHKIVPIHLFFLSRYLLSSRRIRLYIIIHIQTRLVFVISTCLLEIVLVFIILVFQSRFHFINYMMLSIITLLFLLGFGQEIVHTEYRLFVHLEFDWSRPCCLVLHSCFCCLGVYCTSVGK